MAIVSPLALIVAKMGATSSNRNVKSAKGSLPIEQESMRASIGLLVTKYVHACPRIARVE